MSSLGHFIGEKVERLRNNMLVLLLLLLYQYHSYILAIQYISTIEHNANYGLENPQLPPILIIIITSLHTYFSSTFNDYNNLVSTHLSVIYLYICIFPIMLAFLIKAHAKYHLAVQVF